MHQYQNLLLDLHLRFNQDGLNFFTSLMQYQENTLGLEENSKPEFMLICLKWTILESVRESASYDWLVDFVFNPRDDTTRKDFIYNCVTVDPHADSIISKSSFIHACMSLPKEWSNKIQKYKPTMRSNFLVPRQEHMAIKKHSSFTAKNDLLSINPKEKTIAFVISAFSYGGAEKVNALVANELVKQGHNVTFVFIGSRPRKGFFELLSDKISIVFDDNEETISLLEHSWGQSSKYNGEGTPNTYSTSLLNLLLNFQIVVNCHVWSLYPAAKFLKMAGIAVLTIYTLRHH